MEDKSFNYRKKKFNISFNHLLVKTIKNNDNFKYFDHIFEINKDIMIQILIIIILNVLLLLKMIIVILYK